jgi:cysteine desulfurase
MVIYLDHNATTPVDSRVLEAMLPLFTETYANPASSHLPGRAVADLVAQARTQVSELVGAEGYGVVFTSGATEAVNLAVRGVLGGMSLTPGRSRVLVGATEHHAVLESARAATAHGRGALLQVGVGRDGRLDLKHLRSLLVGDVALVAVMAANNETGAVTNLGQVARMAHEAGALVFSDVTQAAGKIPVCLREWQVDLAVLSGHKIYGPKGVGAMVARRGLLPQIKAMTVGGPQEHGLRAGTLNTPGIVGLGRAARIAAAERPAEARRLSRLTRLLQTLLEDRLNGVSLNGPDRARLPNTLNLRFAGAPADAVISCVPQLAVSSGAACAGGTDEPSHVLVAMRQDAVAAREGIRFSLGRATTETDIREAAQLVAEGVDHVRGLRGAMARWRSSVGSQPPPTAWN